MGGVPSISEGRGGCLTKNQPPPPPVGRVLLLSKEENFKNCSENPEYGTRNMEPRIHNRNSYNGTRTFGWNEVETKLHEQVVGRLVGVSKLRTEN